MLTPLSWLKDYVDIDVTPKELEEKLFSCGFEVEESYEVGKDISNVVVGLVEKCEPIPETHLSLCQVNAGAHGTFQICCGADNVKAGGKYPLALIGATVYATAKDHVTIEGVMEIKQGKLRGYDSYGMLCSGVELGLNEDLYPGAGYNGLLVLPEDAKAGDDVKPILCLDDCPNARELFLILSLANFADSNITSVVPSLISEFKPPMIPASATAFFPSQITRLLLFNSNSFSSSVTIFSPSFARLTTISSPSRYE